MQIVLAELSLGCEERFQRAPVTGRENTTEKFADNSLFVWSNGNFE